jgi:inosine-uridine nucleoside N-ribohydrolase
MRQQLIIDCDPGHDDAVAILLALQHADVHGITTVSGNAPLQAVTQNALALMDLVDSKIPVHAGADQPLAGAKLHAQHVHGASGFGGVSLPTPRSQCASNDAVGFLLAASREIADLWIVAIGPLTNIALAIAKDPQFVRRIRGISIMGGSTSVGNATATAEFNVLADPEAAASVFSSGANLMMCGLNLTRQLMTDDAFIDPLREQGVIPKLVTDLYTHMHERMVALTGERRSALHDPCAVLALTHPELIRFEARFANVELNATLTRGMTVVDERVAPPGKPRNPANVEVAYEIDAAEAKAVILAALLAH